MYQMMEAFGKGNFGWVELVSAQKPATYQYWKFKGA